MVTTQKDLILFDIDGVIADDTHRVHHALNKEWVAYFDRISGDSVLQEGADLIKKEFLNPANEVQYLTGRRIDLYHDTSRWLQNNGLPNFEKITMRGFAHRTVLAKYKAGVIQNALESGYFSSVTLYEDDPEVVRYVNEQFGDGTAILCTWYVKNEQMVKKAVA